MGADPGCLWFTTLLRTPLPLLQYLNSGPHKELPTIVDIAKIYPNSIVFRIGMLYSMFILFLINLIIMWALQEGTHGVMQQTMYNHTKKDCYRRPGWLSSQLLRTHCSSHALTMLASTTTGCIPLWLGQVSGLASSSISSLGISGNSHQ